MNILISLAKDPLIISDDEIREISEFVIRHIKLIDLKYRKTAIGVASVLSGDFSREDRTQNRVNALCKNFNAIIRATDASYKILKNYCISTHRTSITKSYLNKWIENELKCPEEKISKEILQIIFDRACADNLLKKLENPNWFKIVLEK